MSNFSTQQQLSVLLLNLAEAERRLEVLRIVLAQLPDFSPFSLFQQLDLHRCGSISASELLEFLISHRCSPREEDVSRFIKSLDSDSDGRVTFADLMTALLPRTDESLRRYVLGKPNYRDCRMSLDAQLASVRLLETYVESIRELELCKLELANRRDFNLMDTFRLIDTENEASVAAEHFRVFFEAMGVYDSGQNVEALMRVLDSDSDGKVSYLEFIDGVLPGDLKYRSAEKGVGQYLTPTKKAKSFTTPRRRVRSGSIEPGSGKRTVKVVRSASPHRTQLRSSTKMRLKKHVRNLSKLFESPPSVRRALFSTGPELPQLADVLLSQLEANTIVEETRESLALRLDFTVAALFATLDPNDKGYIAVQALSSRLKMYRLHLANDQLSLLIKTLDRDKDRKIRLKDIEEAVIPRSKEYRAVVTERDEAHRKKLESSTFSVETMALIKQFFLQVIENEVTNEKLRQEIVQKDLFSLQKAAQVMDSRSKGFLTASDFRSFLKQHGKCLTENELEILMARYDWDRDGRVAYSDLVTELTPKVPRVIAS